MTEVNTRTGTATLYGGEIQLDDFNTFSPNKQRINNQTEANNLQSQLTRIRKKREEEKMYLNCSLEELKEMRLVSNTNGRPTYTLTDEKWQKEFSIRKLFITPHAKETHKLGGKYSIEGVTDEDYKKEYCGITNWQQYCSYINDVLNNIRSGQIDYCYFIYQIMDLAKFHCKSLCTRYCDGYWEVWLER